MKNKDMFQLSLGVFLLCATFFPADASVVADYQFDHNLNDSSGNGLNATGGNGTYSTNVPGAVINPGMTLDTASYIPGTTQATVAANSILSNTFDSGSFTLQAFVYLNPSGGNFQEVFSDVSGATGIGFSLGLTNGTVISGENGNGQAVAKTTGTGTITAGTWLNVAWVGTYSASGGTTGVQFYLNGVADGAVAVFAINKATLNAVTPSSAAWNIGGPANHFNGLIDDLQINNTALTPAQFNLASPLPVAVPEPDATSYVLIGVSLLIGVTLHRRRMGASV